jgi:hypothetical protein
MKRTCNLEDLEALVEGGLSPEDAGEVQAHAAGCESCGEELRWLRSERELMRRRAAKGPMDPAKLDDLWTGVEERIAARPPARAWWRPMGFSTAVAAAAVLAFIAGRHAADTPQPLHPVEVSQAPAARYRPVSINTPDSDVLDNAEEEWRNAASELEDVYRRERGRLAGTPAGFVRATHIDQSLAMARRSISDARAQAGRDTDARVAVLDGYSRYVHSLQTVVTDLEVAR